MEMFSEIFNENNDSVANENISIFVDSAYQQKYFSNESLSNIEERIKFIIENIYKDNIRPVLAQVLLLLPQCSNENLGKYGEKIFNGCFFQTKKVRCPPRVLHSLLHAVKFILKCCRDNKDLHRDILKTKLPIIEHLSYLQPKAPALVFDCICEYVLNFPSQALSDKDKVEQLCINSINLPPSSDDENVRAAGRVFASLPLPGRAGYSPTAKGEHLNKLLSLVHAALDSVFHYAAEIEEYDFPREHNLPYTTLSSVIELEDPMRLLVTSSKIVCHCLIFIEEFLLSASTRFVDIKPKDLVSVAFRLLQVDSRTLKSPSVENTTLSFLLPHLHVRALKYLRCLVSNGVCPLFLNLIEEQVVDTLKFYAAKELITKGNNKVAKSEKSSDDISGKNRHSNGVLKVRTLCYQCLSEVVKASNGTQLSLLNKIVPIIIGETTFGKHQFLLRTALRGGRLKQVNAAKKSKKSGYVALEPSDATVTAEKSSSSCLRHDREWYDCLAASVRYLQDVVLIGNHALDVKHYNSIYKHLLSLAESEEFSSAAETKLKTAYFGALSALAHYPHPFCPPNYVVLLNLFHKGSTDPDPQVSCVCARALASLSFVTANPAVLNVAETMRLNNLVHASDYSGNNCTEGDVDVAENDHNFTNGDAESDEASTDDDEIQHDLQPDSEEQQPINNEIGEPGPSSDHKLVETPVEISQNTGQHRQVGIPPPSGQLEVEESRPDNYIEVVFEKVDSGKRSFKHRDGENATERDCEEVSQFCQVVESTVDEADPKRKRSADANSPAIGRKKTRIRNEENTKARSSPTLTQMLNDFVDADPDSE